MTSSPLTVRVLSRVAEVDEASWDALLSEESSPFVEHGFLDALEETGCVGGPTGWQVRHLAVFSRGKLVAAAPCYAKRHSMGEYVFDHAFANVAGRLGVEYYPKLVVAAPFSPQTGDRLLVAAGEDSEALRRLLAEALKTVANELGCSSVHALFVHERDAATFADAGYAERLGVQFQWKSRGEKTFDEFLARFDSKRRNQIRRERRSIVDEGIVVETKRGAAIDDATLAHAFDCHGATLDKMGQWGRRYMSARFFERIRDRQLRHDDDLLRPRRGKLEIVVARDGARPIAAAINYAKNGVLYGRHWGAIDERKFLHFEVAYYHSVSECLARGFSRFEPGTQGEDTKGPRGFESTLVRSAHEFAHPRLRAVVVDYLEREAAAIRAGVDRDA